MTRKDAVLKAAAHLAKHPEAWDYMCVNTPENTSDCGCAIGWIAFFKGAGNGSLDQRAEKALGIKYWDKFEGRMTELLGKPLSYISVTAAEVVKALRKYAKTYLRA